MNLALNTPPPALYQENILYTAPTVSITEEFDSAAYSEVNVKRDVIYDSALSWFYETFVSVLMKLLQLI